jgi:hypothetical protein
MRRFTALIAAALVLASPVHGWARGGGGFGRSYGSAGPPPPEAASSPASISIGCGPKRYRDPQTHQCRGPADFGN